VTLTVPVMGIDTLGYMKRLEAAGFERKQAEALAEGLRDEVTTNLATKQDLEIAVARLEHKIEALLWKHSLGVLLGVLAIGGVLIRFVR
jgi:hypothetical protein